MDKSNYQATGTLASSTNHGEILKTEGYIESQKKNILLLIAHHHSKSNIASQRFRGLLRYLPEDNFQIYVFTGQENAEIPDESNIEILHSTAPLLSLVGWRAKMALLFKSMRKNKDPKSPNSQSCWIEEVVYNGRRLVQAERLRGNKIVVMGTYSPIDALIAASLIADAESVPLVQDFRDGLVYENLGRQGFIFRFLRVVLEALVVRDATIISTVSQPLVEYFGKRYKRKRVSLLYNGFDRLLIPCVSNSIDISVSKSVNILIGHFGRISASDASAAKTFRQAVDFLGTEGSSFFGRVEFFGEMTNVEKSLLSTASLDYTLHGQVDREISLHKMGRMSALLLVTGDRTSVATGKIFEYLFSGRRILLFTGVQNEAARILREIGDDDIVIDFSNPQTIPTSYELQERLSRPFFRSFERIKRFEKSEQARELAAILSDAAKYEKA